MASDHVSLQCIRAREALELRVRQGLAKGATARHLVQDVLQFDLPIAARYKHLDVLRILQDNCSMGPGLEALIHGLSILERYAKNLLRSDRPNQWRVVRLSNNIFKTEVDIIKGARDILRLLGYTKVVDDGLAYADDILIPEIPTVASVAADILLLRQELMMLARNEHKQEKDFFSYIPVYEVRQLQMLSKQPQQMQSNMKPETPQPSPVPTIMDETNSSASYLPQPPTYEQVLKGAGKTPPGARPRDVSMELLQQQSSNQTIASPQGSVSQPTSQQTQEVSEEELCDICGVKRSVIQCQKCDKIFCLQCDEIFHKNPKRRDHARIPWKLNGAGDVAEVGGSNLNSASNHRDFKQTGMVNGSAYNRTVQMETSQEQGGAERPAYQPTISGARLPPTLSSRTSSLNDNDNEWTRKVNRMATELMDIDDPEAKNKKLMSTLKDLDKEAEKYKGGIRTLLGKGDEKPSLVAHFQEKLNQIDGVKGQLKTLCGYEDPPEPVPQQRLSNPNHVDPSPSPPNHSGSWSFKSVPSHTEHKPGSYQNPVISPKLNGHLPVMQRDVEPRFAQNVTQQSGDHQPVQIQQPSSAQEESEVPVANLIDLSPVAMEPHEGASATQSGFMFPVQPGPLDAPMPLDLSPPNHAQQDILEKAISPEETPDDVTLAKTTAGAGGDNNATEVWNVAQSVSNISALEDPILQSVFSTPSITEHASLKRFLPPHQNGAEQPAKLIRGSIESASGENPAQHVPEISKEFENMNIQSVATNAGPSNAVFNHEFSVPQSRLENYEDFYQSSGDNDYRLEHTLDVPNVSNRLEESGFDSDANLFQVLSPEALQERIKKEENRLQTTQFLDWIRAGHSGNFQPELVQFSVNELESEGNLARYTPNAWLERKWQPHVESFIAYAKEKGLRIPLVDAEKVLIDGNNNFDTSLRLLYEEQNEQVKDLSNEYGYENARKAMSHSRGDHYLANALLQKSAVQEMYQELDANEAEDTEEVVHIKRTLDIENPRRKLHANNAAYGFMRNLLSETYIALLGELPDDMKNSFNADVVEAILIYPGDVDSAKRYLDNECMICLDKFPRSKITCLPTCGDNGCMYCVTCLEQHLSICITDKNIRDIVCPVCSQPEVNSGDETLTDFFNHIDAILRQMEDKKIHEIFQQKLRDYTLMRMPNFRWCSHCSGGFQYEIERENNLKMVCPFCRKATCYKCKKHWETQHEGISCEQFQLWKESNDPEFQAAGLARHLKENGIDCPDCHFRYALAKGGCMHFKCTQCSHEFCSGCNSPFKHGRACNRLASCHAKGLHAHHPRDCLFFLRDFNPEMFQKLLRSNQIQYNTDGLNADRCQVMEQKETSGGMHDDICGREVKQNCAGLCKLHYNEYLVNLVNANHLDPADVFSIDELRPCLMREDKPVPQRRPRESDEAYRKRLLVEVKKLPLIEDHDGQP